MRKPHPRRNQHKKTHRYRRRQRRQQHPGRSLTMRLDSSPQQRLLLLPLLPHLLPLYPQPEDLSPTLRHRRKTSRRSRGVKDQESSVPVVPPTRPVLRRHRQQQMPQLTQGLKLLSRARKGAYLPPKRLRKVAIQRS